MARRAFGSIKQLPSRTFHAQYLHPYKKFHENGSRNYIPAPHTFKTKTAARAWLDRVKADIDRGVWKSPEQEARERKQAELQARRDAFTWGELYEQFMTDRSYSPGWERTLESRYKTHLAPKWGDVPLKVITVRDITAWVNRELAPGAPAVRKQCWEFFQNTMNHAARLELISDNPCERVSVRDLRGENLPASKRTHDQHEPWALTFDQLNELADAMPPQYRLVIRLNGLVGLRVGEARALYGTSVIKRNGNVVIEIRETYSGTGKNAYRKKPKTKQSRRDVIVPPHIADELYELAQRQGRKPLFESPKYPGVPFGEGALNDALRRRARWLNFGSVVTSHDLRHTAASLMLSQGIPVHVVTAILGHGGSEIVKRYTHTFEEDKQTVAAKLSALAMEKAGVVSIDVHKNKAANQ